MRFQTTALAIGLFAGLAVSDAVVRLKVIGPENAQECVFEGDGLCPGGDKFVQTGSIGAYDEKTGCSGNWPVWLDLRSLITPPFSRARRRPNVTPAVRRQVG